MNTNKHKPLTIAVLTAMVLVSSLNLLAATSAFADTPAASPAPAAADSGTKPAQAVDNSKANAATEQPAVAVDEGTAVTNEPALQALHHINAASAALANKDIKTAQDSLTEADKLLKSIKDSLPTAKIREKLAAAKDNPDAADWTSIYQQLDQIRLFLPQAASKQPAGKTPATDIGKAASTDKAGKASPPSAESMDAVLVALQYTEIDLPVKSAISAVEKAQTALKKEDMKTASSALQNAENNVVVLQGIAENPLEQAHLSIWQALANMKNGSTAAAKRYVDDAVSFLEKAAESTDKATKEAAGKLLEEGKTLQAGLEKDSGNPSTLSGKLERFGLHTEAWAERAMNYAYAKGGEVTGNALKDALIEARFHISNASVELYTAQDPAAAQQELTQAQSSLKQALQQTDDLWADASYKQQVTDMQTQVDKLVQEQPGQLLAGDKQLQQIRQGLQTVIQAL